MDEQAQMNMGKRSSIGLMLDRQQARSDYWESIGWRGWPLTPRQPEDKRVEQTIEQAEARLTDFRHGLLALPECAPDCRECIARAVTAGEFGDYARVVYWLGLAREWLERQPILYALTPDAYNANLRKRSRLNWLIGDFRALF